MNITFGTWLETGRVSGTILSDTTVQVPDFIHQSFTSPPKNKADDETQPEPRKPSPTLIKQASRKPLSPNLDLHHNRRLQSTREGEDGDVVVVCDS